MSSRRVSDDVFRRHRFGSPDPWPNSEDRRAVFASLLEVLLPSGALIGRVELQLAPEARFRLSQILSQEEEPQWLALKLVPGLGTRTSKRLLDRFRSPHGIFRACQTELEGACVRGAVGQSIVSGMARVIDTAGHTGEPSAGGNTWPCWAAARTWCIRPRIAI